MKFTAAFFERFSEAKIPRVRCPFFGSFVHYLLFLIGVHESSISLDKQRNEQNKPEVANFG
jgi:hypothetical protein